MKKFYVLMTAVMSAASLSAQEDMVKVTDFAKPCGEQVLYYRSPILRAPDPSQVTALAEVLKGGYFASFNSEGGMLSSSQTVGGLGSNIVFYNSLKVIDGATYEWRYSDGENYYAMPMDGARALMPMDGGFYYYPELETKNPDFVFKRMDFAGQFASQMGLTGCFVRHLQQRKLPLGMCDIIMGDGWMSEVAADEAQTDIRFIGDGMALPNGRKMDAGLQMFNGTTTEALIYGGNIAFITKSGVPTADKELTIELWTLDLEAETDVLKEKLAETKLSTNDLKKLESFYFGSFAFKKNLNNGLLLNAPAKLPAETDFAVLIKDFTGTNLRVVSHFSGGWFFGNSYMIMEDGSIITLPYTGTTYPCTNMWLSLDMSMPGAVFAFPTMEAPVEGGAVVANVEGTAYNNTLVYTSDEIKDGAFELRYPEWLTVTAQEITAETQQGTVGWEITSGYFLYLEAQALTEGKGRQGWVELYSPELEKVVARFEVGQGEWTPSGVETVKVSNASVAVAGDNLMLTYGEDYSKATIYNVAGSVVASYDLPQGGSFEVPAAELSGVYMVVFEGASREVVKVVK